MPKARSGQESPQRKTVVATAAIIERDGKFLITQRKEGGHLPLAWEFPGGKLEPDEDPQTCVLREIEEEVGVKAKIKRFADVGFYRYPEFNVLLLFYECVLCAGTPYAKDCRSLKWISASEFSIYDFPKADMAVIETLIKESRSAP